jgi:hypothetical protein
MQAVSRHRGSILTAVPVYRHDRMIAYSHSVITLGNHYDTVAVGSIRALLPKLLCEFGAVSVQTQYEAA